MRASSKSGYVSCVKGFDGTHPAYRVPADVSGRRALDRYLDHMGRSSGHAGTLRSFFSLLNLHIQSTLHLGSSWTGNGRWALARGLPRILGHRAGVEAARPVVEAAPGAGRHPSLSPSQR